MHVVTGPFLPRARQPLFPPTGDDLIGYRHHTHVMYVVTRPFLPRARQPLLLPVPQRPVYAHTHTHAYTRTHACTHTQIQIHVNKY